MDYIKKSAHLVLSPPRWLFQLKSQTRKAHRGPPGGVGMLQVTTARSVSQKFTVLLQMRVFVVLQMNQSCLRQRATPGTGAHCYKGSWLTEAQAGVTFISTSTVQRLW